MAYITLNKKHFFNNLDIIANRTKAKDKIALVLKDNAYGHGLLVMAGLAKEYGITKAVVRTCAEAKVIENYFEYILVLGDIPTTKNDKIRYTINDIKNIKKFPKNTKVELKVDSGMHRNGLDADELKEAFSQIKQAGLILEAVFTHHRSADELTSEWFWQNENFKNIKQISQKLADAFDFGQLRFHSANSASLFRTQDFCEDMARVGICAYGCMRLPKSLEVKGLKPVLSLWADKISSRELKKGQKVGYGGTYCSKENSIVSNYNFGYGDGFLRIISNSGYKTPEGKELVGKISMDNSSFISNEDKLLIFEDASNITHFAKTISYEVLTSLKKEIEKKVI